MQTARPVNFLYLRGGRGIPLRRLAAPRSVGQAESDLTHARPLPGGPAPGLDDFSAANPRSRPVNEFTV